MRWQDFSKDYLTFTRKERIGLLALIVIITGIWIFPKVVTPHNTGEVPADTAWIVAAKKLQRKEQHTDNSLRANSEKLNDAEYDPPPNEYYRKIKAVLFYFDPNHLSYTQWKKLGVADKTITTILKYLGKGGHFYKPEDLEKIYGIHPDEFERLEPYIRIEPGKELNPTGNEPTTERSARNKTFYSAIDINTADTSALIALPGIGSKLALRIINFRDRLGGFYSVDQVSETYGLPDSTFQKIKSLLRLENPSLKKININGATKDEMKLHPYLKWNLANAIVEFRNQHGLFSSIDDLKKITIVSDEVFAKIKPYLVTE